MTAVPWDESTRPQAPVVDAVATVDDARYGAGAHLVEIHDYFRAKLALLRHELADVAQGRLDAGVARASVSELTPRDARLGAFCAQYCALVTAHHGHEDRGMFPRLRGLDPALGAVVERLEQEHRVIHGILEQVDRALVEFAVGADDPAPLTEATALLSDALLSHLAYEERELVGPLNRFGF